jgi:hypothetical protein
MTKEIKVTEYTNFDAAFDAATNTKEMFAAFQTGSTKSLIKQYGKRFFVTDTNELYYVTECDLRLLHKADVNSSLDTRPFEYVQIMIPMCDNPNMKGKLRFSGQYVDRNNGAAISKQMEVASFFK